LELKYICSINVKRLNLDNYEEIVKGNIDDLFIKYSNLNSEEKKEFKKEE